MVRIFASVLTFSVARLDSPETFKEFIFVRSLLQLIPDPVPVADRTWPIVPLVPEILRPLTKSTRPVLSIITCVDWFLRPDDPGVMKNVPLWSTTV